MGFMATALPLVAGAAMQWFASQQGQDAMRGASAEEIAAMKAIAEKIDREWDIPEFSQEKLTPQEYALVGKYSPEVAQYVKEQRPQLLTGQGQQKYIGAQDESLAALRQMSQTGFTPQDQAASEKMAFDASAAGKAERANLLRDLAARGIGGTGQEAVVGETYQQQIDAAARQRMLDQAKQSADNRMNALRDYTNLAGQMRSSAGQQEQANVNTMNDFNQRATMSLQKYNEYKAGLQNQAQLQNLQAAQSVADKNTGMMNDTQAAERARQDKIASILAAANNAKLEAQAKIAGEMGKAQSDATREQGKAQAGATSAIGQTVTSIPSYVNTYNTTEKKPKKENL